MRQDYSRRNLLLGGKSSLGGDLYFWVWCRLVSVMIYSATFCTELFFDCSLLARSSPRRVGFLAQ